MKPLPHILESKWLMTVALLLTCSAAASQAATDVDARLKTFAALKRQQTEELAAKLHLPVSAEAREFLKAAEAGDWNAVSNCFERIWRSTGQTETNPLLPGVRNVLYIPIRETFKAYEQFESWNGPMWQKLAGGILGSMPAGSVYFAGTDPSRYFTSVIRDAANSPDILIISQTDLPASFYPEYVRLVYGNRIRIPTEKEAAQAICQPGDEVRRTGVLTAMLDFLTKRIVENNKTQHEFYVEESFVIPWMYPYLEPHGLIMKLNKEPLPQLDPTVVAQDRQFWDALTKELLADSKFLSSGPARNTFAKLRTAIAGLYGYRKMVGEAEAAFKQAVALGPKSLEANLRLSELYIDHLRFDDALAVVEQLRDRFSAGDPDRQLAVQGIARIHELKRQTDDKKHEGDSPNKP